MNGLYRGERVYDEAAADKLFADHGVAVVRGEIYYLSAFAPRAKQLDEFRLCSVSFADSGLTLVPRSEWSARIQDQIARKARVSDYCQFPAYDQASTNYCWYNCVAQSMTCQRLIQGLSLRVLSAASGAAQIKRGRNQGGYVFDAVKHAQTTGLATIELWPNSGRDYRRLETADVTASRAENKLVEVVRCETFDEYASGLLATLPGFGGWNSRRHAETIADLVEIEPGSFGLRLRNSWGANFGAGNDEGFRGFHVFREGAGRKSEAMPSYGGLIRSVTTGTMGGGG